MEYTRVSKLRRGESRFREWGEAYNNAESNSINQSGDATNRVYQMRPSAKRACIENMRNGRVLHPSTFKPPEFGSHASIFATRGRSALRIEIDLSENGHNFSQYSRE
jgi:hypothetical protein